MRHFLAEERADTDAHSVAHSSGSGATWCTCRHLCTLCCALVRLRGDWGARQPTYVRAYVIRCTAATALRFTARVQPVPQTHVRTYVGRGFIKASIQKQKEIVNTLSFAGGCID